MTKKAELEASFTHHHSLCREAAALEAARDPRAALARAVAALPTLRDAVAFARRFEGQDRPPLPAVDAVLRLAPPLFARKALGAVDAWAADRSRPEKAATPDLPDRLAVARTGLAIAVRLWAELAASPAAPWRPLAADAASARVVGVWLAAGLVAEVDGPAGRLYALVTDLRRDVRGKCPACGHAARAALAALLDPFPCPGCRRQVPFVVTARIL